MQKLPERIVEPTVDCPTEGTTRPVRVPRDRRWGSALPFVLASLACCARTPDETAVVGRRSLTYTYTMRVKAFTEKAEQISNPVSWLPISSIVEDGAKVEEGQVIVRFNNENSLFELGALERNRDVIDAELAHRLAEIANREREMQDRLNTLRDQLAVLEARLARLQSAPLADDVRIAEGRLRVARLNQQAAEKDLAKARDRFSRQMISRAELDRHESELREKEATLTYARNELAYTKLPTAPGTIEQTELEAAGALGHRDLVDPPGALQAGPDRAEGEAGLPLDPSEPLLADGEAQLSLLIDEGGAGVVAVADAEDGHRSSRRMATMQPRIRSPSRTLRSRDRPWGRARQRMGTWPTSWPARTTRARTSVSNS